MKQDGITMSAQIPKKIQDQLGRFEQIKTQLQIIMNQKSEADASKREMEMAIKALEERKEGDVYRRVGELLIKVEDVDALKKKLEDDLETMTVRLGSMEKQEESLKKMYESLGNEINEALKGYQ
ncbi:MAG: prefoldin subunit beta [Thermoplasmatota archaeon]